MRRRPKVALLVVGSLAGLWIVAATMTALFRRPPATPPPIQEPATPAAPTISPEEFMWKIREGGSSFVKDVRLIGSRRKDIEVFVDEVSWLASPYTDKEELVKLLGANWQKVAGRDATLTFRGYRSGEEFVSFILYPRIKR